MNKIQLEQFLSDAFEPELVQEMLECQLFDLPVGVTLHNDVELTNTLPLVIEGTLSLSTKDRFGHNMVYYKIGQMESCILNISEPLRQSWGLPALVNNYEDVSMQTLTPSKVLALPQSKVVGWSGKYLSWQKFAIRLYQERLRELILQFDLLVSQKNEISVQNNLITSSIHYAKKIQEAVLSSGWQINEKLPEHFILYKPRDIVSGDFYWMSHLKGTSTKSSVKNGDLILIAAADCTGHGVPGAFMSMLGISFLNEIISHYEYNSTDGILNILRDKIKKSLQHSSDFYSPSDGMDIAMCLIDLQNMKLQFSGANNPLYLFRNNNLIELKATKNPIGHHSREIPFQLEEIEIQKDDTIYIFSDGYKSQFGGKNDRTFKSKNFKQLLCDIHQKPMSEQEQYLETKFNQWRGSNEQTDDVLVMGLKI